MTVGRLLNEMTSYEMEEWKAYLAIEYTKEQRAILNQRAADGVRTRRANMKRTR